MWRKVWLVVIGMSVVLAITLPYDRAGAQQSTVRNPGQGTVIPQGAKVLFYTETGTTVAPKVSDRAGTTSKPRSIPQVVQAPTETKVAPEWLGISYWAEWERPGAAPTRVADPARFVFQSGDRVRFHVTTNTEGYLYVINRGSSGRDTLLFPHAGMADLQNRVEARKEYTVPHSGWIRFDNQPGEEGILFLLSPVPLTNMLDVTLQRPVLSPSASGLLTQTVAHRGAKDLLVETDETEGRQATYAGAPIRPTAGGSQEGPIVTYRTRLYHQ